MAKQIAPDWWEGTKQEGFTVLASETLKQPIPVDLPESSVKVLQMRADWLATADAMKQARQNGAIRRANVLSSN